MSRIGKLPIKLADKVKATAAGQNVNIEGPKGKMSVLVPAPLKVEVKDGAAHRSPARTTPAAPRRCTGSPAPS